MARILVVDDDKSIRKTLRDILEFEKYEVVEASDGLDCIVKIKQNSFDVIISRALSDLAPFVKSALPLLATQGTIMAMKWKVDPKELDAVRVIVPEGRYSLVVENYRLPSIKALRSIVIIKHQDRSP